MCRSFVTSTAKAISGGSSVIPPKQLPGGEYKTAGLLLNIQDIKDREEELEAARLLAEKAELKQSFLANMSHEIRTPLNSIVGFANILALEDGLSSVEREEYIGTINKNSELLLKLINDILELSRIESGYMSFSFKKRRVRELIDDILYDSPGLDCSTSGIPERSG